MQTPIGFTRQTLARETLGFSPDRYQQVPSDRHWQKRNGGNQSKQTLIKPIRETLARRRWVDPNIDRPALRNTPDKQQINTCQTDTGELEILSSVQIDINRFLQTDIGRKETVRTSSDKDKTDIITVPTDR